MEAVAGNWVSSSTTAIRVLPTATGGVSRIKSVASSSSFAWPAVSSSLSLSRRHGAAALGIIGRSLSSVSCKPWVPLTMQVPQHAQFSGGARSIVVAAAQEAAQTAEGTEVAEAEEVSEEPTTSNGASTKLSSSLLEEFKAALVANDEETVVTLESQIIAVESERDALAKQVATLVEEANTARERLLRLNADFDNFRKRTLTEKANLSSSMKSDVIEKLLPMVDNFERAKGSFRVETEGEEKIDRSYQGIYKQFVEIMKGLGVVAVETVAKEFDPNLHEAIMREDSPEHEEGIVIQEFRRGFLIGDKLIRPAMVKVSSGPGPANGGSAGGEVADEGISDVNGGETENAA